MTVRNYRCLFNNCPAMLRVEKNLDTGYCQIFESTAEGATHNSHIEGTVEGVRQSFNSCYAAAKATERY